MHCTYCGSKQHTETNCPKTAGGQSNRLHMRCSYCGSKEHNINACPKTYDGNAARAWYPETVEDDFIEDR
jgi:DNA-directed RNA polymerase subunit RPC12/RpoP